MEFARLRGMSVFFPVCNFLTGCVRTDKVMSLDGLRSLSYGG